MKKMILKRLGRVVVTSVLLTMGTVHYSFAESEVNEVQAEIVTLDWLDLIPEDERNGGLPQKRAPIDHESDTPPQNMAGSFRDDLDGHQVRLPGFVIPLEGDSEVVTELLLVPYFGACIHVPPPPPNQIVYVKFKNGVPIRELWDVVYIVGTLNVQAVESDLGQAGYLIDGITVEDYEQS